MGMVLSGTPSHDQQLRSVQQELLQRNKQLNAAEERITELEGELARERTKSRQIERGAGQLRAVLAPLHHAISMVFGELDTMGIEAQMPAASAGAVATPVQPTGFT